MSFEYEIVFCGLAFSVICIFKLMYFSGNDDTEKKQKIKNPEYRLRSSQSLKTFEQFHKIESGSSTLREVYSNGDCSHCGRYLDLNSFKARYFAFDSNICQVCYGKLMNKYHK